MAHPEAVIAAGFGCRAGCPVAQVLDVLEQALAAAGRRLEEVRALYTADFKHAEAGLLRAAQLLNRPLVALPLADLQAHGPIALTCSAYTLERFGVPSIAETAALAGAAVGGSKARGELPRLLAPRRSSGSATCALAISVRLEEHGP
jgi:cobalt-precorrin 5A hydrolase